jgi:hypothetical protein
MAMLASLWLPILLAAVGVFVVSSLIHMLFKWHNRDYRKLPNEDAPVGSGHALFLRKMRRDGGNQARHQGQSHMKTSAVTMA